MTQQLAKKENAHQNAFPLYYGAYMLILSLSSPHHHNGRAFKTSINTTCVQKHIVHNKKCTCAEVL
jgi:hypothetical protein